MLVTSKGHMQRPCEGMRIAWQMKAVEYCTGFRTYEAHDTFGGGNRAALMRASQPEQSLAGVKSLCIQQKLS